MSEKILRSVYVPEPLDVYLAAQAEKNGRSVSGEIGYRLEQSRQADEWNRKATRDRAKNQAARKGE